MHHGSQRTIDYSLSGKVNPEERVLPRQSYVREREGRENEGCSLASLRQSRMHQSMSLCSADLAHIKRGGRAFPENGTHSHETSECSYKVKTQAHQQPPFANSSECTPNKKRNHFLTVVSRLPTKRHQLKL